MLVMLVCTNNSNNDINSNNNNSSSNINVMLITCITKPKPIMIETVKILTSAIKITDIQK